MIRFCISNEEYRQAMDLCLLCFSDGEEYTSQVFARIEKKDLLICLEEGRVISMCFLLPFTLGEKKGHYVYCACTHPDHRGKGLMTQLLQAAAVLGKERGDFFSFLLPAENRLFDFYKKRGYTSSFYCSYALAMPGGAVPAVLREADEAEFLQLRKDRLRDINGLCHEESAASVAYFDVIYSGGKVLTDGECLAVCYPEKNVFIKELLAPEHKMESMIEGVLSWYRCPMCTVQSPCFEDTYVLGLLRWLGETGPEEIYGNLLLD